MKKIVIIEPSDDAREEYRELLSCEGFDVHTAKDGRAGLDLIWREEPECILLEALLPKVDGFEVLRRVRDQARTMHIPVVMVTELGHEDDKQCARHLGVQEYCVKQDHTVQDVVRKIKKLLRSNAQSGSPTEFIPSTSEGREWQRGT